MREKVFQLLNECIKLEYENDNITKITDLLGVTPTIEIVNIIEEWGK